MATSTGSRGDTSRGTRDTNDVTVHVVVEGLGSGALGLEGFVQGSELGVVPGLPHAVSGIERVLGVVQRLVELGEIRVVGELVHGGSARGRVEVNVGVSGFVRGCDGEGGGFLWGDVVLADELFARVVGVFVQMSGGHAGVGVESWHGSPEGLVLGTADGRRGVVARPSCGEVVLDSSFLLRRDGVRRDREVGVQVIDARAGDSVEFNMVITRGVRDVNMGKSGLGPSQGTVTVDPTGVLVQLSLGHAVLQIVVGDWDGAREATTVSARSTGSAWHAFAVSDVDFAALVVDPADDLVLLFVAESSVGSLVVTGSGGVDGVLDGVNILGGRVEVDVVARLVGGVDVVIRSDRRLDMGDVAVELSLCEGVVGGRHRAHDVAILGASTLVDWSGGMDGIGGGVGGVIGVAR